MKFNELQCPYAFSSVTDRFNINVNILFVNSFFCKLTETLPTVYLLTILSVCVSNSLHNNTELKSEPSMENSV